MEMIDKLRELNKKLDDPYFVKEFEEDFEKFLKERDMKIYHTATQYDYETLMIELEEKGYLWLSGDKPTSKDYWSEDKENSCVRISGEDITSRSLDYYREKYPNENIIEYKAKGTKMKRELEEILHDVSVSVYWGLKDASTVESNLSEAKSSAKKLIEKIDGYLESRKPKFGVGDYVSTITNRFTGVIEHIKEQNGVIVAIVGKLYDRYDGYIRETQLWGSDFRKPTPEEISEYKTALNFHKHWRKPFEVKEGDLIESKSGRNIIILYPENYSRGSFLKDGWKLLKTAEEVNEWIKGA